MVSQPAFQEAFGLIDANGKANALRVANLSGNVVSVLQAGAFFGALGSAPVSGTCALCISDYWCEWARRQVWTVCQVALVEIRHIVRTSESFSKTRGKILAADGWVTREL